MQNLKFYLQRLALLVLLFLSDFAYYLLLFAFPLIIVARFHSAPVLGVLMLTVPAGQLAVSFAASRFLKHSDARLFFIPGFALLFIMTMLVNRSFTAVTFPVIMLSWSCGCALIRQGAHLLLNGEGSKLLGNWEHLLKPSLVLSMLAAPAIAAEMTITANYSDLFAYFGVVIALAALIYLFGFNGISRGRAPGIGSVAAPLAKRQEEMNRSVFFAGFIEAYFWIAGPLTLYLEYSRSTPMASILICLFSPYFVLVVLKNVFRLRIWQLKPFFRYLGAVLILLPLFFKPSGIWLYVDVAALGLLFGLIKVADAQEKLTLQYYASVQLSLASGFAAAALWAAWSLGSLDFATGLALAGVAILLYGCYLLFRSRAKWLQITP